MAGEKTFHLSIVCPTCAFYEGEAIMVELNTTEGQIGVLQNHIPLTAVLTPGVCNIYETEDRVRTCAIHGGFVEILQDSVTIIAEVAEWPEMIDENRAMEAKIRAERRLIEPESETNDLARATLALKRSVARLEIVKK